MTADTGLRFTIDMEKGRPTCQTAKMPQVLQTLELNLAMRGASLRPSLSIDGFGSPSNQGRGTRSSRSSQTGVRASARTSGTVRLGDVRAVVQIIMGRHAGPGAVQNASVMLE